MIYYVRNIYAFSLILIISFFLAGFPFTIMPSYLMNRYGVLLGGKVSPYFFSSLVIISLLTYFIQGFLSTVIDLIYVFIFVEVFGIIAIILIHLLEKEKRAEN